MKLSVRALLAGIAGVALAVGLTLGAWAVVRGDLTEPVRPVRAPGELAPRATPSAGASPSPSPSRASASPSPSEDDDDGSRQRRRGRGSGRSGGDD